MLVYAEHITERLEYTLSLVFKTVLGVDYEVTENQITFEQFSQPKLNYSKKTLSGVQILPDGLLRESTVSSPLDVVKSTWMDLPILFPNEGKIIPFDLLSATFFLVTRYEEYDLDVPLDKHGRFPLSASILSANELARPLVNEWCFEFAKRLNIVPNKKYNRILTFDIDHTFVYGGKPFWKFVGGAYKDLFRGKFTQLFSRVQSNYNLDKDPNNTFPYLFWKIKEQNEQPIFFFLNAEERVKHDKNTSYDHPEQQRIVKACAQLGAIGIHPSYGAHQAKDYGKSELDSLSDLIDRPITKSRQHFLKFRLPATYQRLLQWDIQEDYSMGFPEGLNFRMGITHPVPWFDLEHNKVTSLTVFPIGLMDISLKKYKKLEPEQVKKKAKEHIAFYKKYGGTFVLLWHNSSFNYFEGWEGWTGVFEAILDESKANEF